MLSNKDIIYILKCILDDPGTAVGICHNIACYCDGVYGIEYIFIMDKIKRLVKNWRNYSGDEVYFIYDDYFFEENPEVQYIRACGEFRLWQNRQGELRRECIEFLIAELEKEDLQNANQ